jgi:uncharacterized protein (TIGR02118 family)
MFRLTVAYPAKEDGHFDFEYYTSKHMPMVEKFIGADVERIETSRGMAGAGGGAAPYTCIGQIYLKSLDSFGAAMEKHGGEIMGDIPNYTNIEPVVQIEELV